nr:DUF4276 family protein [Gammaproteobacteria bacterium]
MSRGQRAHAAAGDHAFAVSAGLRSRSQPSARAWQLVNRLAIEELEAWYFGDWEAVRSAYPRVSRTVAGRKGFRNPDAILGGPWEAFERIVKKYRYVKTGLRKLEAARAIGAHLDPSRSCSPSFLKCYKAIAEPTN